VLSPNRLSRLVMAHSTPCADENRTQLSCLLQKPMCQASMRPVLFYGSLCSNLRQLPCIIRGAPRRPAPGRGEVTVSDARRQQPGDAELDKSICHLDPPPSRHIVLFLARGFRELPSRGR